MILVYITCRDKDEAKRISKHLLKKRMIACGNFFPTESMYWWKGKITKDNETILLCKTTEEKFADIKEEVKKIHSYEIPCIIRIDAQSSEEYFGWLEKEI